MTRRSQNLAKAHRLISKADYLSKITHFNAEECKALIYIHEKLENGGRLDRIRMREVLHVVFEITDDIMLDLAFKAFDKTATNFIDELEWVKGLSVMLRGTVEELSDWCYSIYDMNGDGGLAREELHYCLKGCILPGYGIESDEMDDCERDIVEIIMRKLDKDKDGQITLADFKKSTRADPLLLVSIGPCLPTVKRCAAFISLFTEKFRSYTGPMGRHVKKPTYKLPHHNPGESGRLSFQNIHFARKKSISITNVVSHSGLFYMEGKSQSQLLLDDHERSMQYHLVAGF